MPCPRCEYDTLTTLATSPVKGVWEVYQCRRCLYTWRSTEPLRRTSATHYPAEFKMTQADIDNAPVVPEVPPLRARKD